MAGATQGCCPLQLVPGSGVCRARVQGACSRGNRLLRRRAVASLGLRSGGSGRSTTSDSYSVNKILVDKGVVLA